MSVFKCKMCGGVIEFEQGATVGVCDSCGTKQTLPRLDDDRRANLYDRANHFRRNNDYDKAMSIYEDILKEDKTDAEAYWSIVLCRYGIEYVEDPTSHERIPTVNRAQFTSIFMDEDYKAALKYADHYQKEIYKAEAKAIDEIQKGILAISSKEEPFDVFICYKETDDHGKRTQDSVLANDLYYQLTQEGFKVFFSRITLEDKLGTAYEPYIFAALNSAKVMVVLGTKSDYFKSIWVKNEWSRYLALVKASKGKKVLIPAYKDMDPYDLPDEFSHLQAQDMSKLGFMQDLIRGIKKIAAEASIQKASEAPKETAPAKNPTITSYLQRAKMFIEEGNEENANKYCEKVLDLDPQNVEAYYYKWLIDLEIKGLTQLSQVLWKISESDYQKNFKRVMSFGDETLISTIKDGIYTAARALMDKKYEDGKDKDGSTKANDFRLAAGALEVIKDWKDSAKLIEQCEKDRIYVPAIKELELMKSLIGDIYTRKYTFLEASYQYEHDKELGDSIISHLTKVSAELKKIQGWRDSDKKTEEIRRIISELNQKEETAKSSKTKIKVIKWIIVLSLITAFIIWVVSMQE